jgi:hypothetical protein
MTNPLLLVPSNSHTIGSETTDTKRNLLTPHTVRKAAVKIPTLSHLADLFYARGQKVGQKKHQRRSRAQLKWCYAALTEIANPMS